MKCEFLMQKRHAIKKKEGDTERNKWGQVREKE
jgi:hypothetical protein